MTLRVGPRHVPLFSAVLLSFALHKAEAATWGRIEVDAHLDNAGAFHVRERMFVAVTGRETTLERKIATATDQRFVLQRLVREEGGQETVFVDGWDRKNQYMWRNQTLTWWIRDATDPEWAEQTLVYRFDYELRNALTPVWDIPAGPDSFLYARERFPHFFARLGATIAEWSRAPRSFDRRYRLEHDVIFPWFSEREREELKYTLRYDSAWRRVHPEADIGRGTRGSDYRVTQLIDYLAPGWPPAIELWKPATRIGSILGFIALAVLLWMGAAVRLIRRTALTAPSLDRRWFTENIGSQFPEIFACLLGKRETSLFVAPFFGRLRANGVIAVHSAPSADAVSTPTVHLELLKDPATLQPHEQLMMAALFPQGRSSGSALLAQYYAQPGFAVEDALEEAIDHSVGSTEDAEPVAPRRPLLFWLWPWLFMCAAALLIIDTIQSPRPMELVLAAFAIAAVAMFGGAFFPQLIARVATRTSAGIALVALLPVVVAAMTLLALHFYRNTPLTAPGSAGIAILLLWIVSAFLTHRAENSASQSKSQRLAALGARYARHELQSAQPALDDNWIPHLALLGLGAHLEAWRARHARTRASGSAQQPGAESRMEGARPFTGTPPFPMDEEWIEALYVPSEEERLEDAAMREDGQDEQGNAPLK